MFSHDCEVNPCALLISKPLACRMLNFGCRSLNQNHQELRGTPCLNGLTLVWITFATFIFNCCKVIDNPIFCKAIVQATIVSSSFYVSTPAGPHFIKSLSCHLGDLTKIYKVCSNVYWFASTMFSHFELHPWILLTFH